MEEVWISKAGKVYHTDMDCVWMNATRTVANSIGRKVHPLQSVSVNNVGRRTLCRVCANGGESPKRGKGNA